ncbi:Transposable element Tc1 transposase [Araneus ventricosus]|uniref:Transposable element Tc1 transposase n=1 Tax=Araneus ventricosus TaxID=182803 RepID=A0A4Y2QAL4_ARAVE|nr:Transposable element Tc1 transposase [Araneus ventricosus]
MPGRRVRKHSSQLREFERGLIMGMKTVGWSTRRVDRQVDRSECAVRTCWEQWTRDGTYVRLTGSGATRKMTRREGRRIVCDEYRFVLGTDDNRERVWRRPGERYNSTHVATRHIARTAGVIVWGAITYASRSALIVVRVTLTDQRYVNGILRPHVGPLLNGLLGAIFQQENDGPHTVRFTQDFLHHVQTLPWQARSPDLSPIEHVWDQLKRQTPLVYSVHDLEVAVQDLWVHLPQEYIRRLINTIPNRVAACIAAGGGPTSY